jgi:hypothetical protein
LSAERDLSPQHRKTLAFQVVNCYFHRFRKNWAIYCPLLVEQTKNNTVNAFDIDRCISHFPDVAQPEFFKYYIHIERIYRHVRRIRRQTELQLHMRKGLELGIVLTQQQTEIAESLNTLHNGLLEITREYSHIQSTVSPLLEQLSRLQTCVGMFSQAYSTITAVISLCDRQSGYIYNLFSLVERLGVYISWLIFCRFFFCCLPRSDYTTLCKGLLCLFLFEGTVFQLFFNEWRWTFRFATFPLLVPTVLIVRAYYICRSKKNSKTNFTTENGKFLGRLKIRIVKEQTRLPLKRKSHLSGAIISIRKPLLRYLRI